MIGATAGSPPPAGIVPSSERFRGLLLAGVLLLPAIFVFAPGLHYPFVQLDDVHHVVENPAIRDLSWNGIRYLFLDDTRDLRYFPVSYLSLALDFRLFGLDPFYFHLTNLALHLANTLLVSLLVARLFRDAALGFFTALLFSIHPLQVESVAWVISRKQVLFLFFFLLAALAYVAAVERLPTRRLPAAALLGTSAFLYLLACLSKTAAITLPAALVFADYARNQASRSSLTAWIRESLPSKLVYVPVLAFVIAVSTRTSTPNPFRTEYAFDLLEWLVIVGHNFFFYVAKTLVPSGLGVFYPLPAPGALPAHFALFALLGGALFVVFAAGWWRSRPVLVFGLGWYLTTITPMAAFAAFFSDLPLLAADRYYYQSSIGLLAIPVALGLAAWRARPSLRPLVGLAATAVVITLCVVSSIHRTAWSSTTALYEDTLANHPNDEFYYRLALEYAGTGRTVDAFRALDAAERAPSRVFFMNFLYYRLELARLYLQKHDFAAAADQLEAGIASTPNAFEPHDARTPLAYLYLSTLRERADDEAGTRRALEAAARAVRDPEHYFEITWIRAMPAEAERFLAARVAEQPDDAGAWFAWGIAAELAGETTSARSRIERAVALGYRP